jgi:DNA-binding transcriptional MerR regulator
MQNKVLRSGELAGLAGVSTDLLRHYERIGVLPKAERGANGYRAYPPGALRRVRVARRAVALGFTLQELARIFGVRDRGGAPCRTVRALAGEKLRQVEENLAELLALRRQLRKMLTEWDLRLRKSAGKRADLLYGLDMHRLDGVTDSPPQNAEAARAFARVSLVNGRKKRNAKKMQRMLTEFAAVSFALSLLVGGWGGGAAAQEKPASSAQEPDKAPQEQKHHRDVEQRGEHVMGFTHDKATHHFRLYADGGAIEVAANDAKDAATRDAIEGHFSHIVKMFVAGDFTAPVLIHSQNPPGSQTMKRLRGEITYQLEKTAQGSRIRITTKNGEAVQAVHAFLRFQIADHQTGDPVEVTVAGKP